MLVDAFLVPTPRGITMLEYHIYLHVYNVHRSFDYETSKLSLSKCSSEKNLHLQNFLLSRLLKKKNLSVMY